MHGIVHTLFLLGVTTDRRKASLHEKSLVLVRLLVWDGSTASTSVSCLRTGVAERVRVVCLCPCRPRHVQIADLVTMSVHQSGAKYIARPSQQQQ